MKSEINFSYGKILKSRTRSRHKFSWPLRANHRTAKHHAKRHLIFNAPSKHCTSLACLLLNYEWNKLRAEFPRGVKNTIANENTCSLCLRGFWNKFKLCSD